MSRPVAGRRSNGGKFRGQGRVGENKKKFRDPRLVFKNTPCRLYRLSCVIFVVLAAQPLALAAVEDSQVGPNPEQSASDERAEENATNLKSHGIIPALGVLFKVPEEGRLRYPDAPIPAEGDVVYNRALPIGAEAVLRRGFVLPRPYGLSLIGVHNRGEQLFNELSVAVGIDTVPPADTPLKSIPFVNVETLSVTDSIQLKGDMWVWPFLNVYASVGKIKGTADVNVVVDLDSLPTVCRPNPIPGRPPICVGENLAGQVNLQFPIKVEPTTATIGTTGVYSYDNWFGTVTLNGTVTISAKDTSDVRSWGGGARIGRRWFFGRRDVSKVFSPYLGATYTDVDTRISGTTRLTDALPDGSDITVRFEGRVQNEDKWAGALGFNLGFRQGISLQGEWNKSSASERYVLSLEQRF